MIDTGHIVHDDYCEYPDCASGCPFDLEAAPVPNQPKTPLRSVRISDELWQAAQAKAAARGETVSDVLRRSLERYTR